MRMPYKSVDVGYLYKPWESYWEEQGNLKRKALGILLDKRLRHGDTKVRVTIEEIE